MQMNGFWKRVRGLLAIVLSVAMVVETPNIVSRATYTYTPIGSTEGTYYLIGGEDDRKTEISSLKDDKELYIYGNYAGFISTTSGGVEIQFVDKAGEAIGSAFEISATPADLNAATVNVTLEGVNPGTKFEKSGPIEEGIKKYTFKQIDDYVVAGTDAVQEVFVDTNKQAYLTNNGTSEVVCRFYYSQRYYKSTDATWSKDITVSAGQTVKADLSTINEAETTSNSRYYLAQTLTEEGKTVSVYYPTPYVQFTLKDTNAFLVSVDGGDYTIPQTNSFVFYYGEAQNVYIKVAQGYQIADMDWKMTDVSLESWVTSKTTAEIKFALPADHLLWNNTPINLSSSTLQVQATVNGTDQWVDYDSSVVGVEADSSPASQYRWYKKEANSDSFTQVTGYPARITVPTVFEKRYIIKANDVFSLTNTIEAAFGKSVHLENAGSTKLRMVLVKGKKIPDERFVIDANGLGGTYTVVEDDYDATNGILLQPVLETTYVVGALDETLLERDFIVDPSFVTIQLANYSNIDMSYQFGTDNSVSIPAGTMTPSIAVPNPETGKVWKASYANDTITFKGVSSTELSVYNGTIVYVNGTAPKTQTPSVYPGDEIIIQREAGETSEPLFFAKVSGNTFAPITLGTGSCEEQGGGKYKLVIPESANPYTKMVFCPKYTVDELTAIQNTTVFSAGEIIAVANPGNNFVRYSADKLYARVAGEYLYVEFPVGGAEKWKFVTIGTDETYPSDTQKLTFSKAYTISRGTGASLSIAGVDVSGTNTFYAAEGEMIGVKQNSAEPLSADKGFVKWDISDATTKATLESVKDENGVSVDVTKSEIAFKMPAQSIDIARSFGTLINVTMTGCSPASPMEETTFVGQYPENKVLYWTVDDNTDTSKALYGFEMNGTTYALGVTNGPVESNGVYHAMVKAGTDGAFKVKAIWVDLITNKNDSVRIRIDGGINYVAKATAGSGGVKFYRSGSTEPVGGSGYIDVGNSKSDTTPATSEGAIGWKCLEISDNYAIFKEDLPITITGTATLTGAQTSGTTYRAWEGDEITIDTSTSDSPQRPIVTCNGQTVSVTTVNAANHTYSFVMPADAVTISMENLYKVTIPSTAVFATSTGINDANYTGKTERYVPAGETVYVKHGNAIYIADYKDGDTTYQVDYSGAVSIEVGTSDITLTEGDKYSQFLLFNPEQAQQGMPTVMAEFYNMTIEERLKVPNGLYAYIPVGSKVHLKAVADSTGTYNFGALKLQYCDASTGDLVDYSDIVLNNETMAYDFTMPENPMQVSEVSYYNAYTLTLQGKNYLMKEGQAGITTYDIQIPAGKKHVGWANEAGVVYESTPSEITETGTPGKVNIAITSDITFEPVFGYEFTYEDAAQTTTYPSGTYVKIKRTTYGSGGYKFVDRFQESPIAQLDYNSGMTGPNGYRLVQLPQVGGNDVDWRFDGVLSTNTIYFNRVYPSYTVTMKDGTLGDGSSDTKQVEYGDTVYINHSNYSQKNPLKRFENWKFQKTATGEAVSIPVDQNETFVMPDYDVTVSVEYTQLYSLTEDETNPTWYISMPDGPTNDGYHSAELELGKKITLIPKLEKTESQMYVWTVYEMDENGAWVKCTDVSIEDVEDEYGWLHSELTMPAKDIKVLCEVKDVYWFGVMETAGDWLEVTVDGQTLEIGQDVPLPEGTTYSIHFLSEDEKAALKVLMYTVGENGGLAETPFDSVLLTAGETKELQMPAKHVCLDGMVMYPITAVEATITPMEGSEAYTYLAEDGTLYARPLTMLKIAATLTGTQFVSEWDYDADQLAMVGMDMDNGIMIVQTLETAATITPVIKQYYTVELDDFSFDSEETVLTKQFLPGENVGIYVGRITGEHERYEWTILRKEEDGTYTQFATYEDHDNFYYPQMAGEVYIIPLMPEFDIKVSCIIRKEYELEIDDTIVLQDLEAQENSTWVWADQTVIVKPVLQEGYETTSWYFSEKKADGTYVEPTALIGGYGSENVFLFQMPEASGKLSFGTIPHVYLSEGLVRADDQGAVMEGAAPVASPGTTLYLALDETMAGKEADVEAYYQKGDEKIAVALVKTTFGWSVQMPEYPLHITCVEVPTYSFVVTGVDEPISIKQREGAAVIISAGDRPKQNFLYWMAKNIGTSEDISEKLFADATIKEQTVVMPAYDVQIQAVFETEREAANYTISLGTGGSTVKVRLGKGIPYRFDAGKTWKVSGDATSYVGGMTFYVAADAEYEFE